MRVLVINPGPFGTLIDALKLCEYLGRDHAITYLSFNASIMANCHSEEVPHPSVKLITVPIHPWFIVRSLRWYLACMREVIKDYDVVYLYYFRGCSLLRVARPRQPMVLDIRSGCVSISRLRRRLMDRFMWFDAKFFKNVAVISDGLRRRLGIAERKAHIVPLGADRCELPAKTFDDFHLLYVGNFYRVRKLDITIRAFARLYREWGGKVKMSYTLVGGGVAGEDEFLKQVAAEAGISDALRFTGYVPHGQIINYLASCNIGMAYVPITEFFDHQPPTKTFEYLMAGMPVLATGTTENRRFVTGTNGIVAGDSEDAVFAGLQDLMLARQGFDSIEIRRSIEKYSWEDIVLRNSLPYLEKVMQGSRP